MFTQEKSFVFCPEKQEGRDLGGSNEADIGHIPEDWKNDQIAFTRKNQRPSEMIVAHERRPISAKKLDTINQVNEIPFRWKH